MESWVVVFLGVIALSSVIQIGFLVTLGVIGMRAAKRASALQQQAREELREPIRHVTEATRHVREITALVSQEVRTLRDSAHVAAEEVRSAKQDVVHAVRSPWVEVSAFAKGVTRAASTFRTYAS